MLRTDRRRVVIASLFTAVALPALWFFNNDPATQNTAGSDGSRATAPVTTKYEPETPLFVGGTDTPRRPSVINVAVPTTLSATSFRGVASFHRYPDTFDRACTAPRAPDGAALTVTNIDNGQTTTCTNTLTLVTPDGIDVLLHTDVFAEIGNVTDAPIPVRVNW